MLTEVKISRTPDILSPLQELGYRGDILHERYPYSSDVPSICVASCLYLTHRVITGHEQHFPTMFTLQSLNLARIDNLAKILADFHDQTCTTTELVLNDSTARKQFGQIATNLNYGWIAHFKEAAAQPTHMTALARVRKDIVQRWDVSKQTKETRIKNDIPDNFFDELQKELGERGKITLYQFQNKHR